MSYLIRSAGGQRTAMPIGCKRPVDNIQGDLIAALKGMTIKFELKITDVVSSGTDSTAPNSNTQDATREKAPDTISQDGHAPETSKVNGIESNISSRLDQVLTNGIATATVAAVGEICKEKLASFERSQTSQNETSQVSGEDRSMVKLEVIPLDVRSQPDDEVLHPNMKPMPVNEFRTSIRPVISSRQDMSTEKPKPNLNFTPFQVLKRQAESHFNKPQRPTFVDPLGENLSRPVARQSLSSSAQDRETSIVKKNSTPPIPETYPSDGRTSAQTLSSSDDSGRYESQQSVVTKPLENPTKPTITWGSAKVGSIIDTCFLSEDVTLPGVTYITYDSKKILEVTQLLNQSSGDIEMLPRLRAVNVNEIVFAKSTEDDSWYRAIVKEVGQSKIEVFYVDWGTSEKVTADRIRHLSDARLSLTAKPTCAIKVRFTNESNDQLTDLFEQGFKVSVNSFDEFDSVYTVTALLP